MKTIIIGNGGSGKTWLARRLVAGGDTPIIHLDDLFWEPGGFDKKRGADEVDRLIEESKRHLGREQSEEGLKRLVEWASHYYDRGDLRSFVGHRSLMEKFPGKTLRLTSDDEVNRFAVNELSSP